MCGRYTLIEISSLGERFNLIVPEGLSPRYNIAPTQKVPVILNEGTRRLALFKWGLIPSWAKDCKMGARFINARAETVHEKPSFRHILRHQRCLVPADGFYEWEKNGALKKPYRYTLKSGDLFAIAGLWDAWESSKGETVFTFTIITTTANETVSQIHDRMPVIIRREAESIWLDNGITDSTVLKEIMAPYSSELMESQSVSILVNSPRNDRPDILSGT